MSDYQCVKIAISKIIDSLYIKDTFESKLNYQYLIAN